ncbi:MAG: DUF2842 domain-containing protein [Pseudomonadota bacterium]
MPDLSHTQRRRLSLVLLLVWLPIYIVVAVTIMTVLPRMPLLIELLVYAVLGVAWAYPFKFAFMGVGKEDPDASPGE